MSELAGWNYWYQSVQALIFNLVEVALSCQQKKKALNRVNYMDEKSIQTVAETVDL